MRQCCLQVRSDQKVEYFPLSASSSTTTSKLLPAAERAETKLKRPKSRPKVNDRIVVVSVVCRGRGQLHTAASYTPGHTCKLELRRRMPPCQAEPLGARRWRDRASRLQASASASKQASVHQVHLHHHHHQPYRDHTSCAPPTPPNSQHISHHGPCHLLGRAPPVHQLGCAPQARHSLEFGHWQLRPSDCGMLGLGTGNLVEEDTVGPNAEQTTYTGRRPSDPRTPRRPQQTANPSHIPW